jgi:hypothetical protein
MTIMPPIPENPNLRKGQFLWRDEPERSRYIEKLSRRIADGFYFSDDILSQIVEELAPVFNETLAPPGP